MIKKGVSPIIAAVVLILITTILGGIIFTWSANSVPQQILLSGSPIELRCSEVALEAALFDTELELINRGNIPLAGFVLKIATLGQIETYEVTRVIEPGESASVDLTTQNIVLSENAVLSLSPILPGETPQGVPATHTCEQEIEVIKS